MYLDQSTGFLEEKGDNCDLSGNYANFVVPRIESRILSYEEGYKTFFVDLIDGGNEFYAIRVASPLQVDTIKKLYEEAEHCCPEIKGLIFEIGEKSDYPTSINREFLTKNKDYIIKIAEKKSSSPINSDQIGFLDKEKGLYSIFCSYPFFQSSQEIVDCLMK